MEAREIKWKQGKSSGSKENQGKSNGKQGKSRENQILMKKVHKKQVGIKGNRNGKQHRPEEIDRRKAN